MNKIFTLLFILSAGVGQAQWVVNGSFEESANCPGGLGQINLIDDWFVVVNSADFYDCGFTSAIFPLDQPDGYCGSAFVGFASYGDAGGSAEAIGQELAEPFTAGQSYVFEAAAKMATGGQYGEVCTGLCLYGFTFEPPNATAQHPINMGGTELGCTETIDHFDWQEYSFEFVADQAYTHIVISPGFAPNCGQNLFVDCVDVLPLESDEEIFICEGESALLEPGLGVVDWYEVDGGNLTFLLSDEAYTYSGTENIELLAEGIDQSITYIIVVKDNPDPDLGADIEICLGEEASFTLTEEYDEIFWNGEAGGPTFTTDEAGTVVLTVSVDDCTGTDEVEVELLTTPVIANQVISPASCPGACDGSIVFDGDPDYAITVDGQNASNDIQDLCAGTYVVEVTLEQCSVAEEFEITELSQPFIDLPESVTICAGSEVTFTASSANALTYTWDNGAEGAEIVVEPEDGEAFCVSGVNASGCEAEEQCIEAEYYPELLVSLPDDLIFCPGDNLVINADINGGEGVPQYMWMVNGEAEGNATAQLQISPNESVEMVLMVTDDCESVGVGDTLLAVMSVVPEPQLSQSAEEICIPDNVGFTVENADDYIQMGWLLNEEGQNGANVFYSFAEEGCFDMLFSATTPEGCSVEEFLPDAVCALPVPSADFSVPKGNRIYVNSGSYPLINTSQNANYYQWFIDDEVISEEEDPVLEEFTLPGIYAVCVEAFNNLGCSDIACTEVEVLSPPVVYIPNAFTPDLDGVNDVFRPVFAFETDYYELLIFNRWGDEVFRSQDPDAWWQGEYQNGEHYVGGEVYNYQLTIRMPDTGENAVYKGTVTVLR